MVNQAVLDYLKRYSGMYAIEDLEKKIIDTGYSPEEVEEAARILGMEEEAGKKTFEFQTLEKKLTVKNFKWMKLAGIIGVIFLIFGIIGSIFSVILPFFYTPSFDIIITQILSFFSNSAFIFIATILFLLFPLALIVFYKGFNKMGKVCESKLLRISSAAFIFLIILGLIFIVLLMIFGNDILNSILGTGNTGGGLAVGAPTGSVIDVGGVGSRISGALATRGRSLEIIGFILIIAILLLVLLVFINTILFFIGLIKTGNKAKFAKRAGILGVILFLTSAGFAFGLILNPFLLIAISASGFGAFFIGSIFLSLGCLVLLFMTLSLFDASRKFEG